ncbi:MAG: tRNA lysidine(34) synthetase TilS [Victivallales bacterium]|nr:tRNA lysidine(34) synthetase TilS [Victivallales bacterium]
MKIVKSVQHFLCEKKITKIYVSFSGGADSTCLLVSLNNAAKQSGINITAVHFEHGLRGKQSLDDAAWCREFCRKRNIEYIQYSLNIRKLFEEKNLKNRNIESLARELRFDKFKQLINDCSEKAVIALGHNKDDRIENLFIRLLRGGNTTALSSLRKVTALYGLTVIRPLLDFPKKEIKEFLTENGINDWREDHTNKETAYRRNFIRNKVLPDIYQKISTAPAGLEKALDSITTDAEYLEQAAENEYFRYKNRKHLDTGTLLLMHDAVLIRFLRYWISDKMKKEFIPDRKFFERFKREISSETFRRRLIPLKNNEFLSLKHGKITVQNKYETIRSRTWNWRKENSIQIGHYNITADIITSKKTEKIIEDHNKVYFDVDKLPSQIIFRSYTKGDRMVPFGKKTEVKLKKIFSDKKIPAEKKPEIPIMCLPDNRILWIIGVKRSNYACISDKTKEIVCFTGKDIQS